MSKRLSRRAKAALWYERNQTRRQGGLLYFLRQQATLPARTEIEDASNLPVAGLEWLNMFADKLSARTNPKPTCFWKGVCVVLDGVWQDNPAAREFREVLDSVADGGPR